MTTPLPVTSVGACLVQGFHTSGPRIDENTFKTEFSTASEGVGLGSLDAGGVFSDVAGG
jgi:hypothetical protein